MTDGLDMVRVVHVRGFSDGLGGTTFRDGVSDPVTRRVGERIATALSGRVIGVDEAPWPSDPAPVEAPPAPDAPSAALPPEPAPDDAPVVSPAHAARPAPSALPPQHHPRRR